VDCVDRYASSVRRDLEVTEPLVEGSRRAGRFAVRVPELAGDVHDLEGLVGLAAHLFPDPDGR
jgi:hypothetical protein